MNKSIKINKGYSIVEIMVVMVIVLILATLGVSAYTTQSMRPAFAEAIQLLEYQSKQYVEMYNLLGTLPKNMTDTLIATPNTRYVSQIYAGSYSSQGTGMFLYAILQDRMGFGVNNRIALAMVPDQNSRTMVYYCGQWQPGFYVPTQYLPNNCNMTNIRFITGLIN